MLYTTLSLAPFLLTLAYQMAKLLLGEARYVPIERDDARTRDDNFADSARRFRSSLDSSSR